MHPIRNEFHAHVFYHSYAMKLCRFTSCNLFYAANPLETPVLSRKQLILSTCIIIVINLRNSKQCVKPLELSARIISQQQKKVDHTYNDSMSKSHVHYHAIQCGGLPIDMKSHRKTAKYQANKSNKIFR